ncbi:LPS translocon maturation chaperone LptM [Yersinia pekkanenii]|uniref:LPS-assembly lipoprotein LptM n=1 Tax=Yersinia pekkanenii TaxID=1288385 RepID=A0A0T9NS26_9GAMM|nr:lipoprotein [Yersinia pekkanenii]CNH26791.1 putative lipoprotein [Yersinia pekkanenii]CRY67252.1 putative lipoprotein [Yersinia pekkanenii]
MKKEFCWPLAAMMVLALAGCGLKGPLYFPPSDKPKVETAQPDSGQVEKNQQDQSGANQTKSIVGPL